MREMQPAFSVLRPERLIRFGALTLELDVAGFGILSSLIERAGGPLSALELLSALEPGTAANPAQLWEAVATVNQALASCGAGAGYIAHLPDSGFALMWPPSHAPLAPGRPAWVNRRLTPVLGREDDIQELGAQLRRSRLVTIVGPGGMGKTTLAWDLGDAMQEAYADGVCFVDLGPLSEARLLPGALAAALAMPALEGALDLAAYLHGRQLLIVLDSCEHLVDAVAKLVESLLSDASGVHVLATSREPLRAFGECVHRLEPLRLPARSAGLTAAAALAFAAIQLFVQRAHAGMAAFELTDESAPCVAQLCIQLDGVPLAIELAAARVGLLGLRGLASQVEHRLLQLDSGRRRVPQRHRTLEAMLDWSHDLLSDEEQRVFRRLSVFRGPFDLTAALAVAGDADADAEDVRAAAARLTELILDLVAKSLLRGLTEEGSPTFRMLGTTRAYAAFKLAFAADRDAVHRRHAQYMRVLMTEAEQAWEQMGRADWRAVYAPWANDLRAALSWAYATEGEHELALNLTNLAFPLADQTALLVEYVEWAERALETLPRLQGRPPLLEIRLRTLPALFHQREPDDRARAIGTVLKVLSLARASGHAKSQAGPLLALWGTSFLNGDYQQAWRWNGQMRELAAATSDRFLQRISHRTAAQTHHFLGEHETAFKSAGEVLAAPACNMPWAYFPSPVDARVSMQIVMARILWLQGRAGEALARVQECLEFASTDTPQSHCQALAQAAIPVALWCGDTGLARQWNERLRELVTTYGFNYWRPWWQAFERVIAHRSGDESPPGDLEAMALNCATKLRDLLPTFEIRCLSSEALARAQNGQAGWCMAEILRARVERYRLSREAHDSADGMREAEALLQRALQKAREQGALAWELRAALSLCSLWQSRGERQIAHALLLEVRKRFTDALRTADLVQADAMLAELNA